MGDYESCANTPVTRFPLFMGFTASTPVIPQLYYNVYSPEERWKKICCWLKKLTEYADSININVGSITDDIDMLEKNIQNLKDGGLLEYYENQIAEWIQNNLLTIWKTFSLGVFFGLTDDGYFCAYVPESWSDIMFDTGAVYGRSDYGRLILRVDVDGSGVIDNSYGYTLNSGDAAQIRGDLEMAMKTLFSDLTETIEYQGAN